MCSTVSAARQHIKHVRADTVRGRDIFVVQEQCSQLTDVLTVGGRADVTVYLEYRRITESVDLIPGWMKV